MGISAMLSYADKRAVVTGGASGMGAAVIAYLSELGAEVFGLDVNPVDTQLAKFIRTDLGDKSSIDQAVREIGGPVHALFNVAGLPGRPGTETQTMTVNFVGHRYLTESLLAVMPRGAAIVNVTSLAGYMYKDMRDVLLPLVETTTFEEATAWLDANEDKFNGYGTSKEVTNLWTALSCKDYAERHGVRINAVAPGSTDTPLLEVFKANAISRIGSDAPVEFAKGFLGRFSHAEDQAAACVFLNSDAAAMITGQVLAVDGGMAGATDSGVLPKPAPRGRS